MRDPFITVMILLTAGLVLVNIHVDKVEWATFFAVYQCGFVFYAATRRDRDAR